MTANHKTNMDYDSTRDPLPADRPAPDYPYLRFRPEWTSTADVERLLALARKENAPQRAISRENDGTWYTVDDIRDRHTPGTDTTKALAPSSANSTPWAGTPSTKSP